MSVWDIAISEGHGDAAVELIKRGAETGRKDKDERLALDLAPDMKVSLSVWHSVRAWRVRGRWLTRTDTEIYTSMCRDRGDRGGNGHEMNDLRKCMGRFQCIINNNDPDTMYILQYDYKRFRRPLI